VRSSSFVFACVLRTGRYQRPIFLYGTTSTLDEESVTHGVNVVDRVIFCLTSYLVLVNNQIPLLPLKSRIILWRICVRIRKVINIRQKQSVQVCIPTRRWMLLSTVHSNGRIVTWNTTVGWPKVGLAMVSLIFASFVFSTDLISDVRV
jgi:hypothetical protein